MNDETKAVPYPDRHHLLAAEGWLDLGCTAEAEEELGRVATGLSAHPQVLDLRWRVFSVRGDWEEAVRTATRLVGIAPDDPGAWIQRSFALHELKRTVEARAYLLEAAVLFPTHPIVAYNLACYCCRLGDLDDARDWLRRAAKLKGKAEVRAMAKTDADLAPIWHEIKSW